MYQSSGPRDAWPESGGPELVDVEIATELRIVNNEPEEFDLYEWALEFSKAAGFEVERVPPEKPVK